MYTSLNDSIIRVDSAAFYVRVFTGNFPNILMNFNSRQSMQYLISCSLYFCCYKIRNEIAVKRRYVYFHIFTFFCSFFYNIAGRLLK